MYPEGNRKLRAVFTSNGRVINTWSPVVTGCRKPLLSAKDVTKLGNNISLLDSDGGFILCKNSRAWELIDDAIEEAKNRFPDSFTDVKVFNKCYYVNMSFTNPDAPRGSVFTIIDKKAAEEHFPPRPAN